MHEPKGARHEAAGPDPTFVISYARTDAAYVRRLAACVADAGLPLWFDGDMNVGDRFSREIQARIRNALAVVVVMSEAAERSDWVEREILEALRSSREFVPVLLTGSTFFLLNNLHYFNARGGLVFGEREIGLLRAIRVERATGVRRPSAVSLVPAAGPGRATARYPSVDHLARRVELFLKEGQIEFADIMTTTTLLTAVNRSQAGWMRDFDAPSLAGDLLEEIDSLWATWSRGRQGFGRQTALAAETNDVWRPGDRLDFSALAAALGWKPEGRRATPKYGAFVRAASPPDGFFPTLRNPQLESRSAWFDRWVATVNAVHRRLRGGYS